MDLTSNRKIEQKLERMGRLAKKGLDQRTGRLIAQTMRKGPGSVDHQFRNRRGESVTRGSIPWPSSHSFGACAPGTSTLQKSGRLRSAWIGRDSASITRIGKRSVAIGVNASGGALPYALVFQSRIPVITKAKTRLGSGRLAMQLALGLGPCQLWLTEGRLLRGFKIDPRPVGVSRQMIRRAGRHVFGAVRAA